MILSCESFDLMDLYELSNCLHLGPASSRHYKGRLEIKFPIPKFYLNPSGQQRRDALVLSNLKQIAFPCPGSSGVEQWTENPRVGGSNPPPGTTIKLK